MPCGRTNAPARPDETLPTTQGIRTVKQPQPLSNSSLPWRALRNGWAALLRGRASVPSARKRTWEDKTSFRRGAASPGNEIVGLSGSGSWMFAPVPRKSRSRLVCLAGLSVARVRPTGRGRRSWELVRPTRQRLSPAVLVPGGWPGSSDRAGREDACVVLELCLCEVQVRACVHAVLNSRKEILYAPEVELFLPP